MEERIIRESIESLRREGLRFSVDTLAERLNISKKTVYKYFPNKEALARALYRQYYADVCRQAEALASENTDTAHLNLLSLYFDAKAMTSSEIFNKYKLNGLLRAYTEEENGRLLKIIFSSLREDSAVLDEKSFEIILDGSLEKLCNEKISPTKVLETLVKILW